jgi:hypothetical protein
MLPAPHRPAHRHRPVAAVLGIAAALTLTACSSGGDAGRGTGPTPSGSAKPHGYVEGATEAAEPQLRLLLVDAEGRTARHDLLTGESSALDDVDAPDSAATDGRFLVTSDHTRTTVVDGGSWTVDHGDHTHYYDARSRVVGTLDEGGPVTVASSESTTTVSWPDAGHAVALDRDALGRGTVRATAEVDGSAVLLPVDDLLVTGDAEGDRVRVLDASGESTGVDAPCTDPAGGIVTRVGAVVGCADGAVLVATGTGGDSPTAEVVAAPEGHPRATAFANRSGRPTVAALAGETGYWLLDTRARTWEHVATDRPLRAVSAVDDADEHVVAVDADGRLVVHTRATGDTATTEVLLAPDDGVAPGDGDPHGAGTVLQLDAQRAYVADPADDVVHEVDFADDARLARSVETPVRPVVMAEVGR